MDCRLFSILLIVVFCLLRSSNAAVTGWTSPAPGIAATSADGTITAAAGIAENSAVGTTLFTATATVAGTASYVLTTDASGKGTIDTATGIVTLATGQLVDFETTPTLVFVVEATDDNDTTKGTATVTLPITDVNEAPAFSSATTTACFSDNSAAGTTLGTYTASDPDAGNTITYSIASGNTNTDFSVGGFTGVITVATGQILASATTSTYTLVVNAVDNDGTPLTGTTTITVTVGGCSGVGAFTALMSLVVAAFVTTVVL